MQGLSTQRLPTQRLSTGQKLAYTFGGMAMNLTNLVIAQWLVQLYAPDKPGALILVSGFLFSAFFVAGRVTDGITDPLVAYWSDRLKSPRGRRIPFILWGLPIFALVYFLLWTPPIAGEHWLNAVYCFVLIQIYFVMYTVVVTPYLALIPELSPDPAERVNITTMQAVFVMVGSFAFAATGPIIEGAGFAVMGLVIALLSVVSFLPTILAIKEKPTDGPDADTQTERISIWRWVKLALQNKPFAYLIASTSLYWFALNLLLLLGPGWAEVTLGLNKDAVAILMVPFLITNLIFFFVFNRIAKTRGKYVAFVITLLGSALTMPLLAFVGHLPFGSPTVQSAIVFGLIGAPAAGFMMLPFAILADIADLDETITGFRREAIFFGTQAIFQKSMIGLSIPAYVFLREFEGKMEAGRLVSTTYGLKLVAIVAGAAALLSFFAFLGYPLREKDL